MIDEAKSRLAKKTPPDWLFESASQWKTNLSLSGYTWFGHNRMALQHRTKKGFGGVGFFICNTILETNKMTILDKSIEGILWIKVSAKKMILWVIFVCVICHLRGQHVRVLHMCQISLSVFSRRYMYICTRIVQSTTYVAILMAGVFISLIFYWRCRHCAWTKRAGSEEEWTWL